MRSVFSLNNNKVVRIQKYSRKNIPVVYKTYIIRRSARECFQGQGKMPEAMAAVNVDQTSTESAGCCLRGLWALRY